MELTRSGFRGPVAVARPSKQVSLLVRAALRKILASLIFDDLTLETDFCIARSDIWWSSLQSWSAPLCFSMRLKCVVVEKIDDSLFTSLNVF